jgi:hypothetical protein
MLDLNLIRQQHALGYSQCHVDELIAEIEQLRASVRLPAADTAKEKTDDGMGSSRGDAHHGDGRVLAVQTVGPAADTATPPDNADIRQLVADFEEAVAVDATSPKRRGICWTCGVDFDNEARLNRAVLVLTLKRLRKLVASDTATRPDQPQEFTICVACPTDGENPPNAAVLCRWCVKEIRAEYVATLAKIGALAMLGDNTPASARAALRQIAELAATRPDPHGWQPKDE